MFKSKLPKSPSILNGFTTSDELRWNYNSGQIMFKFITKISGWILLSMKLMNLFLRFQIVLDEIEKNKSQTDRVRRVGFSHKSVPNLSLLEGDEKI